MAEYTASTYTVTVPALTDPADANKAFTDYHDDMAVHLDTLVKKTGTSQTLSSPLVLSGTTVTASAATFTVSSATAINVTGTTGTAITIGASNNTVTVVPLLTATAGLKGDIFANNGTTKILENGTGATGANAGATLTNYDAILYGTAATARSAVLFKAAGGDFGTTMDGFRRIFVGASAPTGTLNAGDIWMW